MADEGLTPAFVALRRRSKTAWWLTALAFVILFGRLFRLQVMRGDEWRSKGRRNFVSELAIPHDRGIIFDRHGRPLVDNQATLSVQATPAFLGSRAQAQETLALLAALLGLPKDSSAAFERQRQRAQGLARFVPFVVARDLTSLQVEAIDRARSCLLLDGVDIVEGRKRIYHFGSLAAHTLGYTGEIDAAALEAERLRGNPERYQLGDLLGKDGLERMLESELRGVNGSEGIVVDAKGRRQLAGAQLALLGERSRREPVPGHNVYLTLDLELQQVAEAAFLRHGRAGSVVALDAKTFEVLALASLPAYDVNRVAQAFRSEDKAQLDRDVLKPWLNRSIAGLYAPGSTFKIVTALAGLAEDQRVAEEGIVCPGSFRLGSHTWRCWRDAGHGPLPLSRALKHSCDVFFYTLGNRYGLDKIAQVARTFGFGERTGLMLRGEQPGLVPDEAYHRRADASRGGYVRGMAINTSIGQGALTVTPLQLALAYAALASGRRPAEPTLVSRVESADQRRRLLALSDDGTRVTERTLGEAPKELFRFVPPPARPLPFAPAALEVVRRGLSLAAQEAGGTAFRFRSQHVSMAGKTGTTQVVKLGKDRHHQTDASYFARDHAWFVAYAPSDDPGIVVAVLNEHGSHGGSGAAPIAVEVIDAWAAQRAEAAATARAATHLRREREGL